MHNFLNSLVRMMGENGQVVDLIWDAMDGYKWPSGRPPMHKNLCNLAGMMGESDQVVDLS